MSAPITVFVTGANGFIGGGLCCALADSGYQVIRASRGGSGLGDVAFDKRDPRPADWRAMLQGVDVVVDLAALAHDNAAGVFVDTLHGVNVDGTLALADAAAESGVGRFIYMSSIGVVGARNQSPVAEIAAYAPADAYASSKAEAERGLWRLLDHRMGLTVIRPPLVYGPNAPGNFGRLLAWARKGRPLPLGAITGNQRSLLGRDNLVDFILRVLAHPKAANQTFHVADERTVSTTGLLRTLANAAGRKPILLPVPPTLLRAGGRLLGRSDTADRLLGSLTLDTHKARALLDWCPPVGLEQGLRDAVRGHAKRGLSV